MSDNHAAGCKTIKMYNNKQQIIHNL